MSHVDEGALHAYLDGALDDYPVAEARAIRTHLEGCAECAARLEGARAVRTRAASILAEADPGPLELPSLEELRREAERAAAPGRRLSRLQRMAWAASVVLALGAGWMLREQVPRAGSVPAEQAGEARVASGPPEVPTEIGSGPADDQAEATEPAPGTAVEAGSGSTGGPTPTRVAERQVPPTSDEADVPAPPEAGLERARLAEAELRERADTVATDAVQARRREDLGALTVTSVAGRGATPAEARSVVLEQAAAPRLADVAAPPEPAAAKAAEVAGSLVVPGLEVLSVSRLELLDGAAAVRVLQLAAVADTVELLHLPAGYAPSVLGEAAAVGVNELVVPRHGGWLLMRGRVSLERLRALLARLEGSG